MSVASAGKSPEEARKSQAHFKHWPSHAMPSLTPPATNVFYNAEVSARRYPDKPYLVFYDSPVTFAEFHHEAVRVAGYLEQRCGVARGDRVLLLMQNCPQFIIGYYGILRANAVVVPLNPMNLSEEIREYAGDAAATTILVSQELYPRIEPLLRNGVLRHAVVAAYSDYLKQPTLLSVPDFVRVARIEHGEPGVSLWKDVLDSDMQPGPLTTGADELCTMPYTSGTAGRPKGCMHTHRSIMHTAVASMNWFAQPPEMTVLAVAPFFHVTGMQLAMNGPLYLGSTVVLLPRWDRDAAAACIERYKVASWTAIPTMVQDFFSNPDVGNFDLSSIRHLSGGGAPMPAAVAERLLTLGITYIEGYGLTETAATSHLNPPHRPKKQCLGIPIYGVDSRVIDPVTMQQLPADQVGEIVMRGPQVFAGYWNRPLDTAKAFVDIDGMRFFRTGDLGRVDEEGYFFLVDRLKRMINASGFKVWPTEVETHLYEHAAVQEACIIASKDAHRGETVKALIVLKPDYRGKTDAQAIIDWSRQNMAAYKIPRRVEFVDALPKSTAGKVLWRELQDRENALASSAEIGR